VIIKMILIIAVIVIILFFIYLLVRKPKEKESSYGGYEAQSNGGLFDKVKDACCTRMR